MPHDAPRVENVRYHYKTTANPRPRFCERVRVQGATQADWLKSYALIDRCVQRVCNADSEFTIFVALMA